MIDEHRQDEAIEYVLGQMGASQSAAFEAELKNDATLREFVADMKTATASMAFTVHPVTPPRDLLFRILTELNPRPPREQNVVTGHFGWLPWAIAAALAIACSVLGVDYARLKRELVAVQEHDVLSQLTIATLTSQAEAYAKVRAVVVWNVEDQRGVVEMGHLPPLGPEQDYQLWVIDPSIGGPVSAGLVSVDPTGTAKAAFQPVLRIDTVAQFALSIEPKGGGTAPRGKIVLAGR